MMVARMIGSSMCSMVSAPGIFAGLSASKTSPFVV